MRYYLSGVADRDDAKLLLEMGIPNILIDPFQFWQIGLDLVRQFPHVALDSGSYAIWKSEKRYATDRDAERIKRILDQWDGFDFWVMPDAIPLPLSKDDPPDYRGSAVATLGIWAFHADEYDPQRREIPVWHWGEDTAWLEGYWTNERKVGIGGMVAIFRGGHRQENKKKKHLLDTARTEVVERLMTLLDNLITDHGPLDRLHLFAANHIPSAVKLAPYCTSMDSSAWLRAARYGYMFYVDSRNGLLSYRPGPKELDREERLRRALPLWREWLEEMEAVPPITAGDQQAAKEAA